MAKELSPPISTNWINERANDFGRLADHAKQLGAENSVLKWQLASARTEMDELREKLRDTECRMYESQVECDILKERFGVLAGGATKSLVIHHDARRANSVSDKRIVEAEVVEALSNGTLNQKRAQPVRVRPKARVSLPPRAEEKKDEDDQRPLSLMRRKTGNVAVMHVPSNSKYGCARCTRRFDELVECERHLAAHDRSAAKKSVHKPHKCDVCGKSFKTYTFLRFHSVMHTGEKPYSCEKCGHKFAYYRNLWAHRQRVTGCTRLPRANSGGGVARKAVASKVISKVPHRSLEQLKNPVSLTMYECGVCDRKCRTPEALRRHSVVHSGERPFACEKCAKTYRYKQDMVVHRARCAAKLAVAVPSGALEKAKYKCDVCGITCGGPRALRAHSVVHSGERPFTCGQCGCTFKFSHNLSRHRRGVCSALRRLNDEPSSSCAAAIQSSNSSSSALTVLQGENGPPMTSMEEAARSSFTSI